MDGALASNNCRDTKLEFYASLSFPVIFQMYTFKTNYSDYYIK